MKKNLTIGLLFIGMMIQAQVKGSLSTLRIGSLKMFMAKDVAEKLTKTSLKEFEDYEIMNKVIIDGQEVFVRMSESYSGEGKPPQLTISKLSTKSPKFRTQSGMGVGSTRYELLEAFKDYSNFEVHKSWDEKEPKVSYFNLDDNDSGTELSFKMLNNIVIEVSIFINEDC